ncbi:methyltransferase domain-containing protein [Limnoraphis robusta Tam1]|uniref:Methyltransferase domain-containing protein n=1 Tax=Limnoraphis robusta CCNP1315 TaxID=3110306 RepID=A0ABU5TU80_9CYAN|nr:methyltransferase domain-containing protein [Limnoraphis robusta]MEA5496112.1 methyltransferase domain-containing protein [Limnoraphis robusta BA-68 BA1]MEA5518456.1 methyltransferase domain-containing protein [Limnoraphis robusta CCNP1315]MEA5542710.1 methyltransferase domain-containing protein [Limnoraphis robusta Tam1]MEA5547082.1 methyltransferase domain-containing protein [Limnoraphis robusta CCNP1324]
MTVSTTSQPGLASRLVNGFLAVKPLFNFAKHQARQMMINRAEKLGVPWRQQAQTLLLRNWDTEFSQVHNPQLNYPEYYLRPFHAYDEGNLSWQAAVEVEVAAYAVHAKIWPEAGVDGDHRLRQSYNDVLRASLPTNLQDIVDLGCSVGMSTFSLQQLYPQANITGVDLSPYFLAVAQYNSPKWQQQGYPQPTWVHAPAEATNLPEKSFDLVSLCLVCHELPQVATQHIFQEAKRLLRPGGYIAVMDMNPKSEVISRMPPYVFTLLKSTEPYLDEYFSLNLEQTLTDAGFQLVTLNYNSPRHRTAIALNSLQ